MKKALLLAAIAALPLAAFGSQLVSARAAAPAVPYEGAATIEQSALDQAASQTCCYVLIFGKWYCMPC